MKEIYPMQKKSEWEPDWYLGSLMNLHINEMVDRYSCLRALRVDLFYLHHTSKYHLQDHRQLEMDLRVLMAEMMQVDVVVGFFWVIEWTEDQHYHAHVVMANIHRNRSSGLRRLMNSGE